MKITATDSPDLQESLGAFVIAQAKYQQYRSTCPKDDLQKTPEQWDRLIELDRKRQEMWRVVTLDAFFAETPFIVEVE